MHVYNLFRFIKLIKLQKELETHLLQIFIYCNSFTVFTAEYQHESSCTDAA